jgi:hypothetical protein
MSRTILKAILSSIFILSLIGCANKDKMAADLSIAISQNNIEGVRALLKKGADPNYVPGSTDASFLFMAASNGYEEITRLLLENGANPNFEDSKGNNALFLCIMSSRNAAIEKALIEGGTNLSHENHKKENAFVLAAQLTDTAFVAAVKSRIQSPDSLLSLIVPAGKSAENRDFLNSAYNMLDSTGKALFASKYGIPYPERHRGDKPSGAKTIRTDYATILITGEMWEYSISVNGKLIGSYQCMGLYEKKKYSTACGEDVVVLEVSPGGNVCEANYLVLAIDKTTIWKSDVIEMCSEPKRISYNEKPGEVSPHCDVTLDFAAVSWVYSDRNVKKAEPTLPDGAKKIKATYLTMEIKGDAIYFFKTAQGETILFELDSEYVGPELDDLNKYQGREFQVTYVTRRSDYGGGNIVETNHLLAAAIQ